MQQLLELHNELLEFRLEYHEQENDAADSSSGRRFQAEQITALQGHPIMVFLTD